MDDEAEIMMKPVCSCGYVFNHLSCKLVYDDSGKMLYKIYRFNPKRCPKCGKQITNIKTKLQPSDYEFVFDE